MTSYAVTDGPSSNKMDRGKGSNELKSCMEGIDSMEIRQTRRGWCQELMGCEAKNEFKYFINDDHVFTSLEDTDCFCRMCCNPIHPFKTEIKHLESNAEIASIDRPCACQMGPCKCCCYQEASFSSGGDQIGRIKETCFYCIPTFNIYDSDDNHLYVLRPPTCCGGCCVNCCAEGNPCGKGCCKTSFRFYEPNKPTLGDAEYDGKILSKPKSLATELFTDANAFDVTFPNGASAAVKGIVMGTTIFLNSIFFEGSDE